LTYQLPLGFTVGTFYQYGSGVPYTRVIRTLESGLGSLYQGIVGIFAEPRGSQLLPSQHLLDIRLEKSVRLPRGELALQLDCYNVFNNNQTTSIGATTDWDWFQDSRGQSVYSIMAPRYFQLGLIYRF
jgi:hypothetical protein